jgi:multidrug efflux pump subunit AcrB
LSRIGKLLTPLYLMAAILLAFILYRSLGTEIFPKVDAGQFQMRLRMPTGTRIERTEQATKDVLHIIDSLAGKGNVDITSSFVGIQPPTYAINSIFLWTSGPHESVMKVNLKRNALKLEDFKEQLRDRVRKYNSSILISFEPADLVDQVMSMGANTPVEIVVQARNLAQGIRRKIKEGTTKNSLSPGCTIWSSAGLSQFAN